MNKRILIPGYSVGENSFGVGKSYVEYFSQYGDVIIAAPSRAIYDNIDLVVLPGGTDVNSNRYGQVPSVLNSHPDLFKEFFLDNNLQGYINQGAAVYGICLGCQMLQVWAGGPLVQHCGHPYSKSDERDHLVHEVEFVPEYDFLWDELEIPRKIKTKNGLVDNPFMVNSFHHQGIDADQLAPVFAPIMLGPNRVVEAFSHVDLPIAGYQGHPEDTYCAVSDYIIRSLLQESETIKREKRVKKSKEVLDSEKN